MPTAPLSPLIPWVEVAPLIHSPLPQVRRAGRLGQSRRGAPLPHGSGLPDCPRLSFRKLGREVKKRHSGVCLAR